MAGEWRETTLGALIETGEAHLQTGPFGTALKAAEYAADGVPLISVREIREGCFEIDEDTPRVREETTKRLPKFLLEAGDIVFGRKGGIDRNAMVTQEQQGWFLGSDGIRLRLTKPHNSRFFSYQMRSPTTRAWLLQNCEGTTMPSLNQGILARVPIVIAPPPEQQAIACVLGALDDKIELNRRRNATLEALARALFRSWFVEFDVVRARAEGRAPVGMAAAVAGLFPAALEDSALGPIPKGWRVGTVGEIVELSRDAVLPGDHAEEVFDHYSIPAYDTDRNPVRESGADIKSQKFAVSEDCVLISKLNPSTPRVWIPETSTVRRIASTEFLVCRTAKSAVVGQAFVYCLCQSPALIEHLISRASGTSNSHQRVRPEDFLRYEILIPPAPLVAAFEKHVGAMLSQQGVLRRESRTLAALRDALLPKLISGELRVPDAERIVSRAV